ncbi:MAG TPA: EAL domain-containing protein, partial [Euzebya sp.]|nr:EAL domain-containing protein [Euzebya sp.]
HHAGNVVGTVHVQSRRALGDADVAEVADVVARFEARITELGGIPAETAWQRLAGAAAALTTLHDHDTIARAAVRNATTLTDLESAVLVTVTADGQRVTAAHGPLGPTLEALKPSTTAAIGRWIAGGASVCTVGTFPGVGFSGSAQVWDAGIRSLVAVPVIGAVEVQGFLMVADEQPSRPTPEDVQVLEMFATHIASTLQAADALTELQHLAICDSLTGLGHGASFHDRLEAAMDGPDGVAVLAIDLDGFTQINNLKGHRAGDRVLVEVAAAMRASLRGSDQVYRIGGDEFAAVIATTSEAEAVSIADRLRRAVVATRLTTVSIGVRVCLDTLDSHACADAIRADADLALQEAKARGRDNVAVHRPALRDALQARARLATELAAAPARGQLRLDYLPIVDLRSGVVMAAEALVRWQHPRLGLLAPGHFIDVAEHGGQIAAVGAWVMTQAIAQAARWRADGLDLSVSVNLSGAQLVPGFVTFVADALRDAGVPPQALTAEITESGLVHDDARIDVLRALHDLGVRVAVDDFGTGYSSLSHLSHLPIDMVKIDRSFVAALEDDHNLATARTIVELAGTLGLICVAEGVETAAQMAHLQALGCTQAQGFWFCRPARPEVVAALVTTRSVARRSASVT